jgi:hypothetical protein
MERHAEARGKMQEARCKMQEARQGKSQGNARGKGNCGHFLALAWDF